jgi:omega-amidase
MSTPSTNPVPTPDPTDHQPRRAHLVQLDITWENPVVNRDRVAQLLDHADVRRGDFVLLPEMFDTGFSFAIDKTNDKRGETLQFLLDLADDLGVTLQGGRTVAACHRCAAKNIASVVAPGQKLLCEYAKMHLFSPGGEQEHFEPGRDVVTYTWNDDLRVQPAICYDLRFPELFRAGAKQGAEVIAIGACWLSTRHAHWRALAVARAIENQAFVLAVNRVGNDPPKADGSPGARYLGGSIAVSPIGEVLGELDDREGVLSVAVDPRVVRAWREKFPALRDRVMSPGREPEG